MCSDQAHCQVGERDLEKWREEDRQEMEREASTEEKIRIRKKEKAKRRGETNRRMEPGQPKKKKIRMEEGVQEENNKEERTERYRIEIESPKKRKVGKEDKKPAKRAIQNHNIKRYISCKKWREEE